MKTTALLGPGDERCRDPRLPGYYEDMYGVTREEAIAALRDMYGEDARHLGRDGKSVTHA